MPRFDGTGPQGLGPKSGRGMGNCQQAQGGGYGQGFGPGFGRRRNCRFSGAPEFISQAERLEMLKAQKKRLEMEIDALEKDTK